MIQLVVCLPLICGLAYVVAFSLIKFEPCMGSYNKLKVVHNQECLNKDGTLKLSSSSFFILTYLWINVTD